MNGEEVTRLRIWISGTGKKGTGKVVLRAAGRREGSFNRAKKMMTI
jgi:hypothetical protein